MMHDPERADQKKENISEKRRLLAFDFVAIELADPCKNKDANRSLQHKWRVEADVNPKWSHQHKASCHYFRALELQVITKSENN